MPASSPQAPRLYVYSSPIGAFAENAPVTPHSALPVIEGGHDRTGPSSNSPRSPKHDESHVARPSNPFILFASEFRKNPENEHKSNRQLSKEAGALWSVMPKPERNKWMSRASEVKEGHAEKYPDYRYQPRRRGAPRFPHRAIDANGNSDFVFTPRLWTPQSLSANSRCSSRKKSRESEGVDPELPRSPSAMRDSDIHPPSSSSTQDSFDDIDPDFLRELQRSLLTMEPDSDDIEPSPEMPQSPPGADNEDIFHLLFPLTDQPGQVPAARLDNELRATSNNVSYGVFNRPLETKTNKGKIKKKHSTPGLRADFENDPFFDMLQFPVEEYQRNTSSSLFDPTYSSFL